MIRKIVNGLIYDGSGSEPLVGGLEIEDGRIVKVFEGDRSEARKGQQRRASGRRFHQRVGIRYAPHRRFGYGA